MTQPVILTNVVIDAVDYDVEAIHDWDFLGRPCTWIRITDTEHGALSHEEWLDGWLDDDEVHAALAARCSR